MRKNRSAALAAATFLLMTGAAIATAPSAYAGTPGSTQANDRNSDFNGDGYEDVLVGAPGATVSGKERRRSGDRAVRVVEGHRHEQRARFSQSTAGVAGAAETGDGFGRAVATGDLDGDGFDDAVVGMPGEDIGTAKDAGGVAILWGSKSGLYGRRQRLAGDPGAHRRRAVRQRARRGPLHQRNAGDLLAVLDHDDLELFAYDSAAQAR